MKYIWHLINQQTWRIENKRRLFLLCNMFAFCFIGLILWGLVGAWTLKTVDWMLCFIGYPGLFGGYLGGIIFLWRQDT